MSSTILRVILYKTDGSKDGSVFKVKRYSSDRWELSKFLEWNHAKRRVAAFVKALPLEIARVKFRSGSEWIPTPYVGMFQLIRVERVLETRWNMSDSLDSIPSENIPSKRLASEKFALHERSIARLRSHTLPFQ